MLMGTYSHSLDEKGRLIIPSRIREGLGESFIITKSIDHCLALYPKAEWEEFLKLIDRLPKLSSEPARRLRRFYFGNSLEASVDKQGRLLIPQNLREYAGLLKDITLVGVESHVEIWDAASWETYNNETDISSISEHLASLNL